MCRIISRLAELFKRAPTATCPSDVQKVIRDHWGDDTLCIKHLIWEKWTDPEDKSGKTFTRDYVVFIDTEGDLDWICDDAGAVNPLKKEEESAINAIMSDDALPCKHLPENEWMCYKRLLGAGLVAAFIGNTARAGKLRQRATDYLDKRMPECSRRWTLLSSTVFLFIIGIVLVCIKQKTTGMIEPFLYGMCGAYVRSVIRAGTHRLDSSSGWFIHTVDSAVRLIVGIILGKVGVFLFQSSLAPDVLNILSSTFSGVCVAAFAAGLIDGLIPSMISTYISADMKKEAK